MQPNHPKVLPQNRPRLLPIRLDTLHVLGSKKLLKFHDQTLPLRLDRLHPHPDFVASNGVSGDGGSTLVEVAPSDGILPHGGVGDVDDRGRVLLEEAHGGELVGVQLSLRGDYERGGCAHVTEDQRGGGESGGGARGLGGARKVPEEMVRRGRRGDAVRSRRGGSSQCRKEGAQAREQPSRHRHGPNRRKGANAAGGGGAVNRGHGGVAGDVGPCWRLGSQGDRRRLRRGTGRGKRLQSPWEAWPTRGKVATRNCWAAARGKDGGGCSKARVWCQPNAMAGYPNWARSCGLLAHGQIHCFFFQ